MFLPLDWVYTGGCTGTDRGGGGEDKGAGAEESETTPSVGGPDC